MPVWKKYYDTPVGGTGTAVTVTDTRECLSTMLNPAPNFLLVLLWREGSFQFPQGATILCWQPDVSGLKKCACHPFVRLLSGCMINIPKQFLPFHLVPLVPVLTFTPCNHLLFIFVYPLCLTFIFSVLCVLYSFSLSYTPHMCLSMHSYSILIYYIL